MAVIKGREAVLQVYKEASARKWVIPSIGVENLTTLEAILTATREHSIKIGIPDLPISLAITNLYKDRQQSVEYTHTRRWDLGLKLFLNDINTLTEKGSPFESLKVLIHLDHTQYNEPLLDWDMGLFSSIMFDASALPIEENIELTRLFMEKRGKEIVVEGACDAISPAGKVGESELTSPELAELYVKKTNVDFIVANLGTEHRASASELKYRGDIARDIKNKVGNILVLHGASSVEKENLKGLYADGICKVNLWTMLERDSSPALFKEMVKHAGKVAGSTAIKLKEEGFLGTKSLAEEKPSLDFFTTSYRQQIIFDEMKKIISQFLEMWYKI